MTNNDFVYRSLGASYLAPSRDIGVMVHGRFFRRGLSYWTGVFRHDGDNARSKNIQGGDETFAARIAATPFRRVGVPGLELGGAFTVSALSDDSFLPNGLRGRTVMTQDTFYNPVYVKGRRQRWEGDVDWTWGPISARSEYTYVVDQRLQQGIVSEDLPDALAQSWYVSGTWIVTGEEKTRPVEPAADLFRGGIGAVEVAARYERLWFGSAGEGPGVRNPRAEHVLQSGDRVLTLGRELDAESLRQAPGQRHQGTRGRPRAEPGSERRGVLEPGAATAVRAVEADARRPARRARIRSCARARSNSCSRLRPTTMLTF